MSQKTNVQQTAELVNSVGQIGCVIGLVAVLIIGLAFGSGWLIDDMLGNERRWATLTLMLLSFPVSLYAMIQISLRTVARANARAAAQEAQAEAQNEEDKDV